jgi:hypothetical protein
MTSSAEQRVKDLVDRWLISLDLHLKYSALSEEDYAQVQPWPAHERPARWILDLAREKALHLKTLLGAPGNPSREQLAESLELMAFLANLVGAQHIQRFIPLAEPANERPLVVKAEPVKAPVAVPAQPSAESADDRTREMPKLKAPAKRAPASSPSKDVEPRPPVSKANAAANTAASTANGTVRESVETPAADISTTRLQANVVADAIRLMKWGRKWHELAPLIARMAERPAEAEVRKILRQHRSAIESQLGG